MKTLFRSLAVAVGLFSLASVSLMGAVAATASTSVNPAVAQIVKMHDSGVPEDVILAHVQKAAVSAPNADEIIYLHEAGVSKAVITALIEKNHAPSEGVAT